MNIKLTTSTARQLAPLAFGSVYYAGSTDYLAIARELEAIGAQSAAWAMRDLVEQLADRDREITDMDSDLADAEGLRADLDNADYRSSAG